MCQDFDIKIAGDKPSKEIKNIDLNSGESGEYKTEKENGNIDKGKILGAKVAERFIQACKNDSFECCEGDSDELDRQKTLLLSFTATCILESLCPVSCTAKISKASFYDALHDTDESLFERASDTGAFSFYYLSYRRGTEVERRIGQTFAMLCSHDGDPIYQELGEAIYCWFSSVVREQIKKINFVFEEK